MFRSGAHYTEVILPTKRPVVKHISQKHLAFSSFFQKDLPKPFLPKTDTENIQNNCDFSENTIQKQMIFANWMGEITGFAE